VIERLAGSFLKVAIAGNGRGRQRSGQIMELVVAMTNAIQHFFD
jgi:hypothetical protein